MLRHPLLDKLKKNPNFSKQLSSFCVETKIPLRLISARGEELWQSRLRKKKASFCNMFHPKEDGARVCRNSHQRAAKESIRWGEAVIRNCCYSLMQIAAPVMDDGKWVATLVASPFLLIEPSELQPEELPSILGSGEEKRRGG